MGRGMPNRCGTLISILNPEKKKPPFRLGRQLGGCDTYMMAGGGLESRSLAPM